MKKNWIFLALFLSIVLVVPGFAQKAPSGGGAPPAGIGPSGAAREPLSPYKPNDFWDGDDPNLAHLIAHPFATKAYVQRLVGPIRDRINELDELTSENKKMIRDVDARAQQGIQLVSEKISLAEQHAKDAADAANKAQLAQTAATQAVTRVSTEEQVVGNLDRYKGSADAEIRFRVGQTVLSKTAKDALDEMAAPLKGQRNYIIEVRGFSPGHGQAAIASSQTMADSVVRYLVLNHHIPLYRIYVLSMGSAPLAGADGKMAKPISGGRVEINLLKNDLVGSVQH
jgi:outer membrane protein OmpA-like peptidoglycan-associated protein